jgi:TonB family protein
MYAPEIKEIKPPKEHRIKVSLKERPEVKKDAAVKNKSRPTEQKLMPKGKQLKEIPKERFKKYTPKPPVQRKPPVTKIETKKPEPKKPKSEPLPPEKPYIPIKEKPLVKVDENRTEPTNKEHEKLYSMLSKKVQSDTQEESTQTSSKRESKLLSNIKDAYGESFGELSPGEQKYILDNQEIMRRITQQVLNRVGRINIPRDLRVNSSNIVEFYLYPNGDISPIKRLKGSGYTLLDDNAVETVEVAYKEYPHPKVKTKIRLLVNYINDYAR